MDGALSIAFSKVALMVLMKSPDGSFLLQVYEVLPLASIKALAIMVFPTPGSPCSNNPFGALTPISS